MRVVSSILFFVLATFAASAQFAVKTNVIYDATATINVGAEQVLTPKWSMDLSGNMNFWAFSDGKRWKHWMLQPEARYWFCDVLGGHFLAAHLLGGQYNVGKVNIDLDFLGTNFRNLKENRYQGWFIGAGVGYGYAWRLHRHWNIEAEVAVGWIHTRYDRYPCAECGTALARHKPHNYYGPTKAALNLVYVF